MNHLDAIQAAEVYAGLAEQFVGEDRLDAVLALSQLSQAFSSLASVKARVGQ